MPQRPLKPCAHPGCGKLVRSRFCEPHRQQRRQQDDAQRGSAVERGYGARHREWRAKVLGRDRLCRLCSLRPATVADHVIPIRDGGARFDPANGQGLCKPCHDGPKQSQDARRRGRGA